MSDHWTPDEYETRRRSFVESRQLHRHLYVHLSLILGGTAAAGWICSWALLKLGLHRLPLRYLLAFAASYAVFLMLVRAWAGFLGNGRGEEVGWSESADVVRDVAFWGDSEGCFVSVGFWVLGILCAIAVGVFGGVPLLLGVAFEVVFAGAVVRSARRSSFVVGDWLGAALRGTWLPAAVTGSVLVGLASYLQHKAPQARSLVEAVNIIWP
jgi:hypothetical protein